jgi:hypothetical protein
MVYTIPRHIEPETMRLALGLQVSDVLGTSNFLIYNISFHMCVCSKERAVVSFLAFAGL